MNKHDQAEEARVEFENRFGTKPWAVTLAPGRVNLIGEHTDYNGLPVLPAALDRNIIIVFRPNDDGQVRITSPDERYDDTEFEVSGKIPHAPTGHWSNYARAASQAVVSELCREDMKLKGFDCFVTGTIPEARGLSSSSALVVATALSLMEVNRISVSRQRLSEVMARGERYVGTEGGGMDQTVCLLAEEGCALKIDFFPIRTEPVPIPSDFSFVTADSLVRAPKTENARLKYNKRAIECRLGALILSHRLGIADKATRLGDLPRLLGLSTPQMIKDLLDEHLPLDEYSIDEISSVSGLSQDTIREKALTLSDGSFFPEDTPFLIRHRVKHILTEGLRVEKSCQALSEGDSMAFGRLMNESHESCSKDFGISCPELDILVDLGRQCGAEGARLTGAGFGGCAVFLIKSGDVETFMKRLEEEYYRDWFPDNHKDMPGVQFRQNESIFEVIPSEGASVLRL